MKQSISESEVRATYDEFIRAYDEADINAIAKYRLAFEPGFGFRTFASRAIALKPLSEHQLKELMEPFFKQMEYYNLWIEEIHVEVHENVGIAWGTHIEEFQITGEEPTKIRVRFSQSVMRNSDGEIHTLLCHRDIQEFDEDGKYIH